MAAQTIEEIVKQIDGIIAKAIAENNPIGYFPSLYRAVTLKVDELTKKGGYFENDQRMRLMVVTFAGRYISAHEAWVAGNQLTRSWKEAFEVSKRNNKLVLQHLVLGINAHINLDLGIAAATVAPGDSLQGFKGDFDKINDLLGSMVEGVQARLIIISPWIGWLDKFTKDKDELLANWVIGKAREAAWIFANKLAAMDAANWEEPVKVRDIETELLAKLLSGPGAFANIIIWIIKRFESNDVGKNIKIMVGENGSEKSLPK